MEHGWRRVTWVGVTRLPLLKKCTRRTYVGVRQTENRSPQDRETCGQKIGQRCQKKLTGRSERTTMSAKKTHEDHIANRRHFSMSHWNMVHKSISIPKAMTGPAARIATDKVWGKWRMKQALVWRILINATVLLVGRAKNKFSLQLKT